MKLEADASEGYSRAAKRPRQGEERVAFCVQPFGRIVVDVEQRGRVGGVGGLQRDANGPLPDFGLVAPFSHCQNCHLNQPQRRRTVAHPIPHASAAPGNGCTSPTSAETSSCLEN